MSASTHEGRDQVAHRVLGGWGNRPRSGAVVRDPTGWMEGSEATQVSGPAVGTPARGVLARGLGRSYGDAALNAGGTVLDMPAAGRLRTFDASRGLLHADAGMSLADVLRTALPHGWFPPVTPGTRHVTLGGALASDVHGKNHHGEGSFADHVVRFGLRTPDNVLHEVVPGEAAFAATAGGMGLTGVVTDVTLRLVPVESAWVRVRTERTADLDTTMDRMAALDTGARYAVAWVDLLPTGSALGRGVITTGDHATVDELDVRARDRPLAATHDARIAVPALPPPPTGRAVTAAVRAFNELYWRRAPARARTGPESIGSFFYPLDVADDWNRIYGAAGFVQYQFVVPTGREEVLRGIVGALAATRTPSYLAVLKRFGPGRGMLSFPLPGWTLALDVPAGVDGLSVLLDGFDEEVAAAGGRVYLAKDGRMRPEPLRAMYPELVRWRAVRDRLDPERRMRSDLARRLRLIDDMDDMDDMDDDGPGATAPVGEGTR